MKQPSSLETQLGSFIKKRKLDLLLLLLGTMLGVYFDWTIMEIAIFLIFIWSLVGPISSQILAGAALFFLIFVPFFRLLLRPERAEEFAIYAYFFLVMAVLQAVIEIRKEQLEKAG